MVWCLTTTHSVIIVMKVKLHLQNWQLSFSVVSADTALRVRFTISLHHKRCGEFYHFRNCVDLTLSINQTNLFSDGSELQKTVLFYRLMLVYCSPLLHDRVMLFLDLWYCCPLVVDLIILILSTEEVRLCSVQTLPRTIFCVVNLMRVQHNAILLELRRTNLPTGRIRLKWCEPRFSELDVG